MTAAVCLLLLLQGPVGLSERGRGEALFRANPKDEEAGAALKRAAQLLPRDPEAHHYYAQWLYANRRDEPAVAEEAIALRQTPAANLQARMQMHMITGLAEDRLNHPEPADRAFRAAVAENGKLPHPDPEADWQYISFLNRNGRTEEADAVARATLRHAPEFGPARLQFAKALARTGSPRKAAEEGERALANIGGDPDAIREAHYFLAKTWKQLKDAERAKPHTDWLDEHQR